MPILLQVFRTYTYSWLASMKLKTKIKIHKKTIDEVTKKYEGSGEKLCMLYEISQDEVRLYIFMLVMLRTQFIYVHSLGTYTV